MSFRPPSRSNRPASGFRTTTRPTTGFRRLDTANGQKPIGSRTVGLDTNVLVENRPITQHGMSGMKISSKGPNRKIADRNYYENLLREKLIEINSETELLKNQINNHDNDLTEIISLEKERNILMNLVRELEGKLADYNLALDKMRSGTDIINLQRINEEISRKNEVEKMRIDAIFLERKNLEKQINSISNEILLIYNSMNETFNNESQSAAFNKLYNDLSKYNNLIISKEKKLINIQHKYHEIKLNLESGEYSFHLKYLNLQKQLNKLNQNCIELREETSGSMNPDQIKQKILERVQNDNKQLKNINDDINNFENKIEEIQNQIKQKERDLMTMKEYSKQSHKYEQLFDRDKKMKIFIDSFKNNLSLINTEIDKFANDNYNLLKHISENEENDLNNSKDNKLHKMNENIKLKKEQKNHAQNTLIYSENELKKREKELNKINNLDNKIQIELENIGKKTDIMNKDILSFKSADQIQIEYKTNKQLLFTEKMKLQQHKEMIEKMVLDCAQKSDKINRKLNENPYHNELKEMETKIAKLSQNIFAVEDTINEYKREGEYKYLLNDIKEKQQQINSLLLQELEMEQ